MEKMVVDFAALYYASQERDNSQYIIEAAHIAVEGLPHTQRREILTPAFELAKRVSEICWAEYNGYWQAAGCPDWT